MLVLQFFKPSIAGTLGQDLSLDSHMKIMGMLILLFKEENADFWEPFGLLK